MYSSQDDLAAGFPHSEIRGSKAARASPRLIATCYVLHRLSVPRHPPNALHSLDPKQPVLRLAASAHSALHNLDLLTNHKSFITPASRTNLEEDMPERSSKASNLRSSREDQSQKAPERPLAVSPCIRSTMSNSKPIGPKTDRQFKYPDTLKEPITTAAPGAGGAAPSAQPTSNQPSSATPLGGAERDRTDDLLLAKQALSQLSYSPNLCQGSYSWSSSRRAFGGPGKI